ncbi:uncharacterized protein LOC142538635 [Primulina tabacum]|uniref:uncharacterized protein LOC142538635 n=1 Tax=Primulina tabacum TaxID=48773 RepID=UPI003F5A0A56
MRQQKWVEFVKDYDCYISYYPEKANVVADALSRKAAVIAQLTVQRPLQVDIQLYELEVYTRSEAPNLSTMTVQATLGDRIREGQSSDEQLQKWRLRDEAKGSEAQIKAEHQRPAGKLKPIPIPKWKWENIIMDFVVGLPRTIKGFNAIWVTVDRLMKLAHSSTY